jgi:hypothetical protein
MMLHSIITKGKKEVPGGTKIQIKLGSLSGTVSVELELPGQKAPVDLGDLLIKDGVVELPVNLVFLSHAKEDVKIVSELSEKLLHDGVITWFDEKDLLPGDEWKLEIENGIDRSDYILVFLSSQSVDKKGYFQKELKEVLERQKLIPEGNRYIIPILIDDCYPPRSFENIHWLKMNTAEWYEKLLRVLRN